MQRRDTPIIKDLVLLGGGHSHVAVIKSLGMKPIDGVRVTVICRDAHTPYSGMLPGLVAGHYGFDDSHIDLLALCRFGGARFILDEARSLDLENRLVRCRGRPPVPFDLLSINIGSTPRATVPGAADNAIAVKPINRFSASWEELRRRVLASDRPTRIAVVGAGAGGVELLLAMQYRLHCERPGAPVEFHLFGKAPEILPDHCARARRTFARILAERHVAVHTGHAVVEVLPRVLRTDGGRRHEADEILWVTEAGAAPWLAGTGLALDDEGFVQVSDMLQSMSHGECLRGRRHRRARRSAAAEIGRLRGARGTNAPPAICAAVLVGETPHPYAPQKHFLSLISTGDKYAVASRGRWSVAGRDGCGAGRTGSIAGSSKNTTDLPDMDEEQRIRPCRPASLTRQALRDISRASPCAAAAAERRSAATMLRRALDRLQPVPRDDVLIGLREADDAALVTVPPARRWSTASISSGP